MKSNSYSSSRIPALLAATIMIGGSANAADYTVNSGETLSLSNGAYTAANLLLQGGTVSGSDSYHAYGASVITGVNVSGSAASTITGSSWFNIVNPTSFTVADVTGDATTDLLVNTSLRALPASGNDWAYDVAKIVKDGAGTMEVTAHSYFRGGLDLNGGTLKLSGGNSGYGFFDGAVNVNSGTTLTIDSDGTGFGYQNSWKPASVNINGGTVNGGGNHVWGISGGVNMTGGTLQVDGGSFQWNYTNLNTNASADTATVAGPLTLRGDGGYTGLSTNVADGAAATDLLISGNISQQYGALGVTKSGDGTMVLSGSNSYSGPTTVSGGTLVLSGTSATSAVTVNAGVLSLGDGTNPTNVSDSATVNIASGTTVNLNFTGTDIVGKLIIDGNTLSGGTYDSSDPTYGSYFTGTGSLTVLAQDGTWTSIVDGNWGTSSNWQSNTIASGTDKTATFSAGTGPITVTLDAARSIGNLSFSNADYTLAGANILTLDSSGTPAVSVAIGRTATIAAALAGTVGMDKTGDGTLVLSGVKSYTGDTTVTAGTLELNSTAYDVSVVNGSVTVADGAALKLAGLDYSGLGRLGSPVTTLNVNGGTVNSSIESWVTGATVNLTGGTMSVTGSGRYQVINSTFISLASANTSTISGNLLVRKDYGSGDLNIEVDDGAAATDLSISGSIQQTLSTGVNKFGTGKLLLSGTNTYTGNTVVNDGMLEVASAGSLLFRPTTNGATNSVYGSEGSSLSFLGAVNLDLSAADTIDGNVWNLFQLGTLTGTAPVLAPTAVTSGLDSFTEVTPGTWELSATNAKWVFTEADGNLTYQVTATDYDNWADSFGLVGGPTADDDNDGLTNEEEYAFGLVPNSGSSVNAISVPLDQTGGTFSYTRRSLTLQDPDLTYTVWYSTDLGTWTEDTGAVQGSSSLNGEVETVPVTISPALLGNTKLFIQVRAE